MGKIKQHVVTLLCLILALFLYTRGFAAPATGLLFLGAIAEGLFWYRLVVGTKSQQRK